MQYVISFFCNGFSLPQRGDTFPYRLQSTLVMHINAFFIWLQFLARCLFDRPPSASVSHSEHVARFCQRVFLPARASARPHEQAGAFDVIERHSARARASHSCPRVLNQSFTWMTVQLPLKRHEISELNLGEWRVREAHWHELSKCFSSRDLCELLTCHDQYVKSPIATLI